MKRHDYYLYGRGELLERGPKIPLLVMKDNDSVFRAMAQEMAGLIRENNARGKRTVLICPVGPVGQYPYLVDQINRERISLGHTWFINMDEYLDDDGQWISAEHPLSFRGFMRRNVYERILPELLMPEEQRVFPDPRNLAALPALIEELGGVDACFGGIGINGHVAFNEANGTLSPEEFLAQGTRVLEISPETRTANAISDLQGAVEDMPRFCVTVGFHEIAQARRIRLGCFRNWHRAAVRRAAYGEQTAAFPVSLLQGHPDILIRLTEYVAAPSGE